MCNLKNKITSNITLLVGLVIFGLATNATSKEDKYQNLIAELGTKNYDNNGVVGGLGGTGNAADSDENSVNTRGLSDLLDKASETNPPTPPSLPPENEDTNESNCSK